MTRRLPALFGTVALLLGAAATPQRKRASVGIVNGRPTNSGEWDGAVMVTGSDGTCDGTNICSGVFIHPEVVLTAGHCCPDGDIKAICGGKSLPSTLLAVMNASYVDLGDLAEGGNNFCMLRLDRPVTTVPIYQISEPADVADGDRAIVVGSGANNEAPPWTGVGTQREGVVNINYVGGTKNLHILARGIDGASVCAADSGGPMFVSTERGVELAGTTSHGLSGNSCPPNGEAIFVSLVAGVNRDHVIAQSAAWFGAAGAIFPGSCPVDKCCYSMNCQGHA